MKHFHRKMAGNQKRGNETTKEVNFLIKAKTNNRRKPKKAKKADFFSLKILEKSRNLRNFQKKVFFSKPKI